MAQAQYLDNLGASFESDARVVVQKEFETTSEVLSVSTQEDGSFFVLMRVKGEAAASLINVYAQKPYLVGVLYNDKGDRVWAQEIVEAPRPDDSASFSGPTGAKSTFFPNGDVAIAAHLYAETSGTWGHNKRSVVARLRKRDGRLLWSQVGPFNTSDTTMNIVDMTVVGDDILMMHESGGSSVIPLADGTRARPGGIPLTPSSEESMGQQPGLNRTRITQHWAVVRLNGKTGEITNKEQGGALEQWQTTTSNRPARRPGNTSDGEIPYANITAAEFSPYGRYVYLRTNAFVHNTGPVKPRPQQAGNDLILSFDSAGQIDRYWDIPSAGAVILQTLPNGDLLAVQRNRSNITMTRYSSSGVEQWSTNFTSTTRCEQLIRDAISVICLSHTLAPGARYPRVLLSSGDRVEGMLFFPNPRVRVPAAVAASGPAGKVVVGGPQDETRGTLTILQRDIDATNLVRPDLNSGVVRRPDTPFQPLFDPKYECTVHVAVDLDPPFEIVITETANRRQALRETLRKTVSDDAVPTFWLLHGQEYVVSATETGAAGQSLRQRVTPSCLVTLD